MNHCGPLLVLATVPADGKGETRLAQLAQHLRRRGLKVQVLRTLGDPALGEYDILMLTCAGRETGHLAQELERLWTQKWNSWYACSRGAGDGHCHRTLRGLSHG